jgi:3-hydroxyisobutyrate dehydrogenase
MDLKVAQDAGAAPGAATPMGAQAAALYESYCGRGEAGKDFSGIIGMLRGAPKGM